VLEVLWPVHALGFAPFAIVAALAALYQEPAPPSEPRIRIGHVVRGSLRATTDGHEFTLFDPKDGGCVVGMYKVTYDGPLPDTVCEGADIAVYGMLDDDDHLEATSVIGLQRRDDPCWKSRCLPEDERPDDCRRLRLRFE